MYAFVDSWISDAMPFTKFVVLACLVAAAAAEDKQEVAKIYPCDGVDQSRCTVGEVRINPCKKDGPCVFKKGHNVSMEFDFTPYFSTNNLETSVSYQGVLFSDLGPDACLLTPCPLVAGNQQVYKYSLYVGKKLPSGTFKITWKVWNRDDDRDLCCFDTTIKLTK